MLEWSSCPIYALVYVLQGMHTSKGMHLVYCLPAARYPSTGCFSTLNFQTSVCNAKHLLLKAKCQEAFDTQETEWTVSGDGEYMRHSIAFPDGAQIGRAWIEKDGEAFWAQGNVRPQTQNMGPPGLITDGQLHHNYQILQARESRQNCNR